MSKSQSGAIMRKALFSALSAILIAGCTHSPIPEGYSGPTAQISDSQTRRGSTSADFFYVSAINGVSIDNSLDATVRTNEDRGFAMDPVVLTRKIPAQPATFAIKGRTHYAAPILELANPVYQVSGTTSFAPVPNSTYVVKGVLGENYSAVWIADAVTGAVMGQKVEVRGSSSLGILEK